MREAHHDAGFSRGSSFVSLAIVLLAAILITVATFWQTRNAQVKRFRSQFESDASARSALITQEADKSLLAIKSLGWSLGAEGKVHNKSFQAFAACCVEER